MLDALHWAQQTGLPGWQERFWAFIILSTALCAIIYLIFFYWVPRLTARRCPRCGERMFLAEHLRIVAEPYVDERRRHHRGRVESRFRCDAGHDTVLEHDYVKVNPWGAGPQRFWALFGSYLAMDRPRLRTATGLPEEGTAGERIRARRRRDTAARVRVDGINPKPMDPIARYDENSPYRIKGYIEFYDMVNEVTVTRRKNFTNREDWDDAVHRVFDIVEDQTRT